MKIGIISSLPEAIGDTLKYGVVRRVFERGQVEMHVADLRKFAKRIDDSPYGGGKGMVIKYQPVKDAIDYLSPLVNQDVFIYPSPSGKPLNQEMVKSWMGKNILFLCGRYEGVDQRIIDKYVDVEVSVSDVILSGGELPTAMILDSIFRLMPGVLGNALSLSDESFEDNLLGCPVYTRPYEVDKMKVPDVLLSGHHAEIERWKMKERISKTSSNRKDLLSKYKQRKIIDNETSKIHT